MHRREAISSERQILIEHELGNILRSKQFKRAPAVQAFLEFVVREELAGRGRRINAYAIAFEVFDRGPEFDPSSDTIVRTTAGRLRKGLQSYYDSCDSESPVAITLPKGRYVPAFEFGDTPGAPPSAPVDQDPLPELRVQPRVPGSDKRTRTTLFALLAISLTTALGWWLAQSESAPTNVVVDVRPVQYIDRNAKSLARELDIRLAPSLSRIGLARIVPPGALPAAGEGEQAVTNYTGDAITFVLRPSLTSGEIPELRWQLIDGTSGHLVWAAKEQLPGTDAASIDKAIGKVSFRVLGDGGAVPLVLDRYHSETFSKQACLSRAQLIRTVENTLVYPEMRECLERAVARSPNDASAWAILSIFNTVRSRYYTAGGPEQLASLVNRAEIAAQQAAKQDPGAYLTKVALMHLALRQRNIPEFDALQKQIRASYPGDIYLKLRIASRIARLGRGWEALEIYEEARENWGLELRPRSAELALAYFVEGEYESAYRHISRTTSGQRYVLALKAAVLGKMGMTEAARPVIDELVASNPEIEKTFYPWFTELSWSHPLVADIAEGLSRAGLAVAIGDTTGSRETDQSCTLGVQRETCG